MGLCQEDTLVLVLLVDEENILYNMRVELIK